MYCVLCNVYCVDDNDDGDDHDGGDPDGGDPDGNHLDLLMVRVERGENTDGALVHLSQIHTNTNTNTNINVNIK